MTIGNQAVPPGMGQCQITGKVVPDDELVTIQGQRVCAEGKAILLERLHSGEAMPGELIKPTVLRRFGASFLDGIIIGVPMAIVGGIAGASAASSGGVVSPVLLGLIGLAGSAVSITYVALLHAARGQTVGKMAAKIKVVNDADGSPITAATAWKRALVYGGPSALSNLVYFTGSEGAAAIAGGVAGVYFIANTVVALIDSDRQRAIHDKVAGTRVIQTD